MLQAEQASFKLAKIEGVNYTCWVFALSSTLSFSLSVFLAHCFSQSRKVDSLDISCFLQPTFFYSKSR